MNTKIKVLKLVQNFFETFFGSKSKPFLRKKVLENFLEKELTETFVLFQHVDLLE